MALALDLPLAGADFLAGFAGFLPAFGFALAFVRGLAAAGAGSHSSSSP